MFTCSVCMRQRVHTLSPDFARSIPTRTQSRAVTHLGSKCHQQHRSTLQSHRHVLDCHEQSNSAPNQHRTHTTLATLKKSHHRTLYRKTLLNKKKRDGILGNVRRQAPWAITKPEKKDALAREGNRAMMLKRDRVQEDEAEDEDDADETDDGYTTLPVQTDQPRKETSTKSKIPADPAAAQRKALRKATKEVETYYPDPLQLANGVIQRLRVPDIEGALTLVRASESLQIANIVSWNHCIDWMMAQGDTKGAIRIYNEMKKRGHRPDAHTYTIMLRGFSRRVDRKPKDVQEAVKVYNSIFAPNSNVQPNTIHTNAIINVCARGGDMDALWAVAGRLPEFGPGSPDRWTYTTILNAIRDNVVRNAAKLTDTVKTKEDREEAEKARAVLFQQALADGRKIWEDVNWKWRRADLVMDEHLVCAMGRLLLGCGETKDAEQVYDLVEQTMNLRIPERKQSNRKTIEWLQLRAAEPVEDDANIENEAEPEVVPQPPKSDKIPARSELPLKESTVYATPSNNTLSLLLETSTLQPAASSSLAKSYWNLLTDSSGPYNITPDAANIISYMRVLRRSRASREVYALLSRDWPDDIAQQLYRRASFIIAFSTCVRDKNNPNVFETAQKLLGLMEEKLEESALGMFDRNVAVTGLKTGKEKRKALKQMAAADKSAADMAGEGYEIDENEMQRRRDGVQSLRVDPKALKYFVELGCATTKGWNEGIRGKDDGDIFERSPEKNNAMIALHQAAPQVLGLKRMIQMKIEEAQFESGLPKSSVARWNKLESRSSYRLGWDPRSGSQVAENLDELLELMRTLVGAYDRILAVAERFVREGKEPISKKLCKDFDDRRRQFTGYMAKIEKSFLKKVQDSDAFEREGEEDDNLDQAQKPQIEQQLEKIYERVDKGIINNRARMRDERTQRKGFKHARFSNNDARQQPPRLHSRRQAKERENLIAAKMDRQFPQVDYGVLDDNLEIRNGDAERLKMQGQERKKRMRLPAREKDPSDSITKDKSVMDVWDAEWMKRHEAQAYSQV